MQQKIKIYLLNKTRYVMILIISRKQKDNEQEKYFEEMRSESRACWEPVGDLEGKFTWELPAEVADVGGVGAFTVTRRSISAFGLYVWSALSKG